jgi:hypothetical protein
MELFQKHAFETASHNVFIVHKERVNRQQSAMPQNNFLTHVLPASGWAKLHPSSIKNPRRRALNLTHGFF